MPVKEKLSQVFHRKSSIPEAPAQPAALNQTTTTTIASEPITNHTLLQQREILHETVYDNSALASDSYIQQQEIYTQPAIISQEAYIGTGNRSSILLREEPTIIERVEKDIVIQERIHPIEKEEIQPVIYREREQLDVKQITQLMHETQVAPTLIEQHELAPQIREAVIEKSAPLPSNIVLPTREIDATLVSREIHAPIIEETIKKTVLEEIQPVIERDIIAPTVIQQTQAIYEKIIEAPHVTREIRNVQELGTRGLGNETVYNAGIQQHSIGINQQHNIGISQQHNIGINQQYDGSAQYNSSIYSQEEQFARERLASQERLAAQERNFSNSSYEIQMREQQLLNDQQLLQNQNRLATGQVLPPVASSRPAYAYLPSNYAERKPDFVGTGSQYVQAAKNVPLTHNKGLHTQTTYTAPQNILRQ